MSVIVALVLLSMLAPGDTCKVEAPLAMSTKPRGKGKLVTLKVGTKLRVLALADHEYEVSTGAKRGFLREDIFDKGCVKLNLPTL